MNNKEKFIAEAMKLMVLQIAVVFAAMIVLPGPETQHYIGLGALTILGVVYVALRRLTLRE